MADLSPNAEVVLTSDLFTDDLCFESMSEPAWAVLDAYMAGWGWLDSPTKKDCRGVAAALRAAADQVVPANPDMPERWEEKDEIRAALLAIANELDNQ